MDGYALLFGFFMAVYYALVSRLALQVPVRSIQAGSGLFMAVYFALVSSLAH